MIVKERNGISFSWIYIEIIQQQMVLDRKMKEKPAHN